MSFKGLAFIRQWAKEHIYKPRIQGEQQETAPILAESFRQDASSAQVKLDEVEEEVGDLEKAMKEALVGRRLDDPK